MILSDYCTINRQGAVFIDIDSGWKFHCNLHGMHPDYAQILIRHLCKKRRINDEEELLASEVNVPDIRQQEIILGVVKTAFEMLHTMARLSSEYDDMRQQTSDEFYGQVRQYTSVLSGEYNDYYYILIEQLMGV